MDLTTITVADFKALFTRDFPYLPVYDPSNAPFNTGDEVYYSTTKLFYIAAKNGVTSIPGTAGDWTIETDDIFEYVQDSDITRAFAEAMLNFNQALLSGDPNVKMAFLYVAAHYLVNDLTTAMGAFSTSGGSALSSRSVGNVSESYAIPPRYLNSPIFQFYSRTGYGSKYLSMVMPGLVGNIFAVQGGPNA